MKTYVHMNICIKLCMIILCVKAKEKKETDQMAINRQQTNCSVLKEQNSSLQLA